MDEQIRPVNRVPALAVSRPVPKARAARGAIMNMTANRLILLLQIYRGLLQHEKDIGTYNTDRCILAAAGLVAETQGVMSTTNEGDAYVKRLLEIGL